MKELIHQYGAWLVFALVFLESIGLPLTGEAILVSAVAKVGVEGPLRRSNNSNRLVGFWRKAADFNLLTARAGSNPLLLGEEETESDILRRAHY